MTYESTSMGQTTLRIGEIAERVGLSLRSVRFYEEEGLITPEGRTEGGFRLYTDEHVERLRLIMHMKPLGFSVQEMRELLDTRDALIASAPGRNGYDEAYGDFSQFVEAATKRVAELRETLTTAESFAAKLRREVANPSSLSR